MQVVKSWCWVNPQVSSLGRMPGVTGSALKQILQNKCVVTYGNLLLTYDMRVTVDEDPSPNLVIDAGDSQITALCASRYSNDVFTGMHGGQVCR
jgi:hypothetical protein